MLHQIALLLLIQGGPPLQHIDELAKKRDYLAIQRFVTPDSLRLENPLPAVKSNGAYDTGRFGWRAQEMVAPGGTHYVVLTTPLSSQDVGDIVLARQGAGLRYVPESDAMGILIQDRSLVVRLDAKNRSVSIQDTMLLRKMRHTGPHFLLRLSPYFTVHGASVNGAGVAFGQAGGVVAVPSPQDLNEFTLTLSFSGKPNLPRYAGSFTANEAQLTNDYWYAMIARHPVRYDLTVHSPKGWVAVGQGEQVSMHEGQHERVTKFRMDMPAVFYSLSVGPYKSHFQPGKKALLGAWSARMPLEDMKLQAELYDPVLQFFSDTFAPYPFTKFGALVTDLYGGGALEAYSHATYGTGWLPDEDAHEPVHTWFGGMLANTYLKSLWSESFADYCDALYRREGPIGNKEEKRLAFIVDPETSRAFDLATCENSPPWIGGASLAIGYGKGAAVLQVLESELGTPLMIKTMREWIARDRGRAVDWGDYARVVERVAGRPMGWFFDNWTRRKGWPRFTIENVRWEEGVLSGEVRFQNEPYSLHLETLLQFADGSKQTVRIDTMQAPTPSGFRFQMPMPKKPSLVSIDPWRKVLRDVAPNEEPVSLRSALKTMKRYSAPSHADYLRQVRAAGALDSLPADLDGVFLVAHPADVPAMGPLLTKVGISVAGNQLTYKGTTIDLEQGGALAVVELGNGKRCAVGLGKTRFEPRYGRARLAVFDKFGRFLRGETEPKTGGHLTFRL